MKKIATFFALVSFSAISATTAWAGETEEEPAVSFEFGTDVVSSYVWRGQELGGLSVQPSATVTFNKANVSFGVWASAELFEMGEAINMTEFDLVLSWNPIDALTVGLTDYYLSKNCYFGGWRWNASASHNLEALISYDFGPLALSWNTCLTGPDHRVDGDGFTRNYSTYVELSAPYKALGVEGSFAVGARLWDDAFTAVDGNDCFNVCNISLSAEKEIFKLPLKGQVVFNPQTDNAYFIVGLTF